MTTETLTKSASTENGLAARQWVAFAMAGSSNMR